MKSSSKSWNEKWKEDNQVTDQAFNSLADGAKALVKITKITLDGVKKGSEKLEKKSAEKQTAQPTQPSSSPTNPDAILVEAASTNNYGIYARREHNDATGRNELHFYKRDGKRITHSDAEYLLTPTQIKTLKHYAEYHYAGKIPSNKRRTLLPSSNQNSSASTGTSTGNKGTSTIPTNGTHNYDKGKVRQQTATKAGLVGSPKTGTLTRARPANEVGMHNPRTANVQGLAGKKDASGSIAGGNTARFAQDVNTPAFGATRRDAAGSIMGTTNKNFVGVNNETPALNNPKNAQGSIAGASGNNIGYNAVKQVANPNKTRQASPSGLVTRNRATAPTKNVAQHVAQQPVTSAQAAMNLSHVVKPSYAHRQAVEQEVIQEEMLQFNAGTRIPTMSGINKARSATPSKIVRNNKTTGEVNTRRPATKSAIKPSRQKSPSRIVRKPAQVTKSAINKAKSVHYENVVKKAVKDAGLTEVKVGVNTVLIDKEALTKSGLKTKSRKKKPSAIKQRARNASPSQLKQPKVSVRYSKLVRRGA
jgi:hypothetical protein